MAIHPQDEKHLPDLKRALDVMKQHTPTINTGDAVSVLVLIMANGFIHTHSKEASLDFLARVKKFSTKYPFSNVRSDGDADKLLEIAKNVTAAWAAMEPPVHTRAIQMCSWMAINYAWQAMAGDDCVKDWYAMMGDWAKHWDGGRPEMAN